MLSAENKPQTTLAISAEQITQIAGNAATHDLRGNLTAYEINGKDYSLEYDLDNRITKVTVDNDEVEYRYDALTGCGKRAKACSSFGRRRSRSPKGDQAGGACESMRDGARFTCDF